jgi:hypothetical protein
MPTAELEKLILSVADDCLLLLGQQPRNNPPLTLNEDCVAMMGDCPLIARRDADGTLRDWMFVYSKTSTSVRNAFSVATEIALAAFIESWRDRLEKEHRVVVTPLRTGDNSPAQWLALHVNEKNWLPYDSGYVTFPEAVVAAVRALAKEKRKASKPAPSPAACRAASKLADALYLIGGFSPKLPAEEHTEKLSILADIIDQEFNRKD